MYLYNIGIHLETNCFCQDTFRKITRYDNINNVRGRLSVVCIINIIIKYNMKIPMRKSKEKKNVEN